MGRSMLDLDKYLEATVFMIFVLSSALTVMNMLIGVLCEVVSVVAAHEKEDNAIRLIKDKLLGMLMDLDEDNSGLLSREEIGRVLDDSHAQAVLESLNVSVPGLIE